MGGPRARILPWTLVDEEDLLKRVTHKKTNFQYWLSINPAEKKQHCKIWVKRYPKDTGVPVPQECHDWVKTSFVLVQDRAPPAEGGGPGSDKADDANKEAVSTGKAGESLVPLMSSLEMRISPLMQQKMRELCPPREARPSQRSGGGLKSATLWAIGTSSRRSCEATWG